MSQLGDDLEKWGADVIFGRARGFGAFVARSVFRCLSFVYAAVVGVRLKAYRQHWKEQSHLGTMVISIGNLTVGGTGKTPVVELLSRSLRDRGRNVAVLSRGYKSKKLDHLQDWKDWDADLRDRGRNVAVLSRGYKSKKLDHLQDWKDWDADRREEMPKIVSTGTEVLLDAAHAGDEPYMLAKNLPGVSVIVDKDRVNGGRFAVSELGADTLVLDDGLQYLRLNHEFDIVLVDQNAPFGTDAILPRGTLREPPRHLCRASHIILTKCQGPTDEKLLARIRKYNPAAEIVETTHAPRYLQQVFGEGRLPLEHLNDAYIAAISGIAVPESFEGLLKKLNADVEFHRTFGDHQTFPQRDVDRFMTRCVERDIEMILTTEKDAVRFPRPKELDVPIYFLRIEIEILRGQEVWDRLIDQICGSRERAPGQWDVERLLLDPVGP